MKFQTIIPKSVKQDLKNLRLYLTEKFSPQTWESTHNKLKESIETLKSFPELGLIPMEFTHLRLKQYRQILSGMNRIIYEIRENVIYIHLICDMRRDLQPLLMIRLLASPT
jgi:toxin ParE1/3/4